MGPAVDKWPQSSRPLLEHSPCSQFLFCYPLFWPSPLYSALIVMGYHHFSNSIICHLLRSQTLKMVIVLGINVVLVECKGKSTYGYWHAVFLCLKEAQPLHCHPPHSEPHFPPDALLCRQCHHLWFPSLPSTLWKKQTIIKPHFSLKQGWMLHTWSCLLFQFSLIIITFK